MKEHGKIKELLKKLIQLFLIFFKVGLFSFGGGYTMVIFYEREFVEKRKWMTSDEFSDLLAIAESTPGPIAINSATYIGYRIAGFFGSFISTVATCLPSFIIIFVISLFFDEFLQFELVQYAFKGIQAGVSLLILIAGIKMFKKMKKSKFNVIIISVSSVLILTFSILAIKFSSIYYILAGATCGLVCYFVALVKNKKAVTKTENGEIVNTISENDLRNSENDKRADNAKDNITKIDNSFVEKTDLLKIENDIDKETELTESGNKFDEETNELKIENSFGDEIDLTRNENNLNRTESLQNVLQEEKTDGGNGGEK